MKRKVVWGIVITIVVVLIVIGACDSLGSSSSDRDKATCSVCGSRYYAGDAGGNYMSIAYSGMCKKCEKNHDYIADAYDYYELND